MILGFFSSGVLVVINRCMAWAADSAVRMRAFEVARENMEKLLSSDSVKEMSEYGDSEKYPGIKWQTDVETFYEPITSRMWVRGVCTAQYEDAAGEEQTIELTHWLTNVTKEQMLQLLEREGKDAEMLAGQVFETLEEAAIYAGVDVDTIQKWIEEGGLKVFPDGSIPKQNIDTFTQYGGSPPPEEKIKQIESPDELIPQQQMPTDEEPIEPMEPEKKNYTPEDLERMGVPKELIPVVMPLFNS